ncbi:MAG: SMC-Scp complex subunit ScpB [Clostridia bacterium]|nr:SMC-Scp complex subunit ScpB [Clostridia bacterium]
METKMLSDILEGILFVAGNGVEIKDIAEKLEVKPDEVKKAIEVLKEKHTESDGIQVITYKDKVQLTSNPKYAEQIAQVLNPIKEKALTKAALETVAIIAYQQPITRMEVEQVRGVSCDYAIQLLLTHNLIEVVGRKDAVGKPILFGTTDEFLKRFEIESLDDLPKYEELLEQIKVIKNDSNALYREFEVKDFDEVQKEVEEQNKEREKIEEPTQVIEE